MLVYSAIASLDGYVVDADGSFAWAAPSPDLHRAVNELERGVETYLYGRRLYEVMRVWQTLDDDPATAADPVLRDYAGIWRSADKIIYSSTLDAVTTPRTQLFRRFDPEAVAGLAARSTVSVGGPTLAAQAFTAGLVDECHLFLHPIAVGGGIPALPKDRTTKLELLQHNRFDDGVVHLHYAVTR